MKLHQLPKATQSSKRRVGRGKASGRGKTSGRGMNGQRARFQVRPGFEGGQTPLIKRLRQLRGRSFRGKDKGIAIVNLAVLDKAFSDSEKVSLAVLKEKGLIRKESKGIKVLGFGKLTKKLRFDEAIIFSRKAAEKIEKQAT